MRNLLLSLFFLLLFTGCRKNESGRDTVDLSVLRSVMTAADYARLEKGTTQVYSIGSNGQQVLRAKMGHEELVVVLSASGNIENGIIIGFRFDSIDPLNGKVVSRQLDGKKLREEIFQHGQIQGNINDLQQQLSSEGKAECIDCTLPEVIVGTSYSNGSYNPMILYSMNWLFGSEWGYNSFMSVYAMDGGGGGAPIDIDIIEPTDKEKIDPKKYTDCFDQLSSDLATYSMTIYADLPADKHPGIVFDHKANYAGHSFIELNKSNPSGSARQVFGFYPGSRWGAISGGNTTSKIVDDSGHEFQASYTITVSQSQFNAAVQRVQQLNSQSYNITNFNCVDFALSVFQAGGGNFNLQTQYNIPVYGSSGGNNTPNGLYEQIAAMNAAGVSGTSANSNKNYGPNGKGPCN